MYSIITAYLQGTSYSQFVREFARNVGRSTVHGTKFLLLVVSCDIGATFLVSQKYPAFYSCVRRKNIRNTLKNTV